MPTQKLTAEIRLYRWLKRKTTPPDAWQHLSLSQLARKARCSTSQVSRTLPKVVAKLYAMSLNAAEAWVHDVMNVRRGLLLDFEIQIILQLRRQKHPVSYARLSHIFEVSEKQLADISKKFQVVSQHCSRSRSFWQRPLQTLIPKDAHHCIPKIQANAEIRRQLREKQRVRSEGRGTPYLGVFKSYAGVLDVL